MDALLRHRERERRREASGSLRALRNFPGLQKGGHKALVITDAASSRAGGSGRRRPREGARSVVPPALLKSCLGEITALDDFRAETLCKPREGRSLRRGPGGANGGGGGGGGGDLDQDRVGESVLERALRKVREVAEKRRESRHNFDLRGFSGAAMTPGEFRQQMHSQMGVRLSEAENAALVAHLDDNDDGQVDFAEAFKYLFNPARLQVKVKKKSLRRSAVEQFRTAMDKIEAAVRKNNGDLRELFASMDESGDGLVSRAEFVDFLYDALAVDLAEHEMDNIFDAFDDADGQLRFTEFTSAYHNRRAFERSLLTRGANARKPFLP